MIDAKFLIGKNRNKEIVEQSSSGGIISLVAEWVLKQGGIVFGATINLESMEIFHIKVQSVDDLFKIRKSKYVWSNHTKCFRELKENLELDKFVLFVGTPCQAYAVKKGFSNYEKLIVLDFYCHGTLKFDYFFEYIKSLNASISSIDFRDDSNDGTHNFVFSVTNSLNEKIVNDEYIDNPLTFLFVSSAGLRKACFSCPFSTKKHFSNITVGDVEFNEMAQRHGFKNKKHLSIISVNDDVGAHVFKNIKKELDYACLDEMDEKQINFYYRAHNDSGKLWEYNVELQKWFEKAVDSYGFIEAAYMCMYSQDVQFLLSITHDVERKKIYLYGCGKRGKILKRLIDKYHKSWNVCGFIVTKKNEDFVDGLPLYQIKEINEDKDKVFIIVAVTEKYREEIYSILRKYGFQEGVHFR